MLSALFNPTQGGNHDASEGTGRIEQTNPEGIGL